MDGSAPTRYQILLSCPGKDIGRAEVTKDTTASRLAGKGPRHPRKCQQRFGPEDRAVPLLPFCPRNSAEYGSLGRKRTPSKQNAPRYPTPWGALHCVVATSLRGSARKALKDARSGFQDWLNRGLRAVAPLQRSSLYCNAFPALTMIRGSTASRREPRDCDEG